MDEIQELVRRVVRQCASRGVTVSEVLAAFVARTVSNEFEPYVQNCDGVYQRGGGRILHGTVGKI